MNQCIHDFKRNLEGEVLCILCGAKDDEMEVEPLPTPEEDAAIDFWSTQTSFE